MSYDNVKLWFAKREDESITTIDEINEDNKNNTYLCPMCGSTLRPKAVKSKQVTSHFAHVDTSKCSSETAIHFWFKHSFIAKGDVFTIVSDKERQYLCKDVLVEQIYDAEGRTYKPDMTITTECGSTIYFEMAFSNKKKVQDYLDIWLELKNIVVEVDIKELMSKNTIPTFKALFYDGKCFNIKKNDTYYNTIGKYKEKMLKGDINKELKERIEKLDWFWNDVLRYRNGEVSIKYMSDLINFIGKKEKEIVNEILNRQSCLQLLEDLAEYEKKEYKSQFTKELKKINLKYNNSIKIKWNSRKDYESFSILSKLRDGKNYEEIGWRYYVVFNRVKVKEDINYINEKIQMHISKMEDHKLRLEIAEINITDKEEKTTTVKQVEKTIRKLNKKFSCEDDSYKMFFVIKNKPCDHYYGEYYRCSVEFSSYYWTDYIFYVKKDGIDFYKETTLMNYLDKIDLNEEIISKFIEQNIVKTIEEEKQIKDSLKDIIDKNIKVIDTSYIVPNDIRFKFLRDLEEKTHCDIEYVTDTLVPEIRKFRNKKEIVLMVKKDVGAYSIIDRLRRYYGFTNVDILEERVKRKTNSGRY